MVQFIFLIQMTKDENHKQGQWSRDPQNVRVSYGSMSDRGLVIWEPGI